MSGKPMRHTDDVNPIEVLAPFLASTLPGLLRRLRADAIAPVAAHEAGPEWDDIVSLRSSSGQMTALGTVIRVPRITMQALAKELSVTPATATAMIKKLTAGGYVERQADESDWRVVCVLPTHKGEQVFHSYLGLRETAMRKRLERLEPSQLLALQAAMPALRALLR